MVLDFFCPSLPLWIESLDGSYLIIEFIKNILNYLCLVYIYTVCISKIDKCLTFYRTIFDWKFWLWIPLNWSLFILILVLLSHFWYSSSNNKHNVFSYNISFESKFKCIKRYLYAFLNFNTQIISDFIKVSLDIVCIVLKTKFGIISFKIIE